jgi:iron complex outermembrane receptor protein
VERADIATYPLLTVGAVDLIDARMSFAFQEDRYTVSLWGKNLADKEYYTSSIKTGLPNNPLFPSQIGAPRTYGIEAEVKF